MSSTKQSRLNSPKNRTANLRAQSAASREFRLAKPPSDQRARELWLEHAAGFVLFEKVRAAGLATLEPDADPATREAVELAVDATMYALMMQIDGVSGGLKSDEHEVGLSFGVELRERGTVIDEVDLFHGDGMCMGFHSWVQGDFGKDPVVVTRKRKKS